MIVKLIKSLILILAISLLFSNLTVIASNENVNPFTNPEYYRPNVVQNDSVEFNRRAGKIFGIVNAVGVICSVAVLALVGIKYMAGSIEEKAEYKKTMIGYIIGAILLFSGTTFPNVIFNVVQHFADTSSEEDSSSAGGGSSSSDEGSSSGGGGNHWDSPRENMLY